MVCSHHFNWSIISFNLSGFLENIINSDNLISTYFIYILNSNIF